MAFAGSVMLGDLNDFIAPSQSCVNPLMTKGSSASRPAAATPAPAEAPSGSSGAGRARATIALEAEAPAPAQMGATVLASVASDFFLPATVKPVRPDLIKAVPQAVSSASGGGGGGGSASAVSSAQVSLADCLACSGCVTSAETVLITQQSTAELKRALASGAYRVAVASISPQALASLAAHYRLPLLDCYARLTTFLHAQGIHAVVDTQVAADVALHESWIELLGRIRASTSGSIGGSSGSSGTNTDSDSSGAAKKSASLWTAPPPSRAVSATESEYILGDSAAAAATNSATAASASAAVVVPQLPLLASSCPGWVCYAEKTVTEALPLISRVRSAQQLTGVFVKLLLSLRLARVAAAATATATDGEAPLLLPSQIYHVSIMQCYDKKLEASRRDFWWQEGSLLASPHPTLKRGEASLSSGSSSGSGSGAGVYEVDCVLAVTELQEWLAQSGVAHLTELAPAPRHGLLYPSTTATAAAAAAPPGTGTPLLEELLCGVSNDGAAAVTPSTIAAQSDSLLAYLYRCLRRSASASASAASSSAAAAEGGEEEGDDDAIPLVVGRNSDFREAVLTVPAAWLHAATSATSDGAASAAASTGGSDSAGGSTVKLGFVQAYGFRNIQGVISRLKKGQVTSSINSSGSSSTVQWVAVEVMACPSGCVNGGGLLKPAAPEDELEDTTAATTTTPTPVNPLRALAAAQKRRVERVASLLHPPSRPYVSDPAATHAALLAAVPVLRGLEATRYTDTASAWQQLIHTRYHAVPKLDALAEASAAAVAEDAANGSDNTPAAAAAAAPPAAASASRGSRAAAAAKRDVGVAVGSVGLTVKW